MCASVSLFDCRQVGVALAEGIHLFPFRTEKLSPPAPMVLPGKPGGRVGRRPFLSKAPESSSGAFAFPLRIGCLPALGHDPEDPVPRRPPGWIRAWFLEPVAGPNPLAHNAVDRWAQRPALRHEGCHLSGWKTLGD